MSKKASDDGSLMSWKTELLIVLGIVAWWAFGVTPISPIFLVIVLLYFILVYLSRIHSALTRKRNGDSEENSDAEPSTQPHRTLTADEIASQVRERNAIFGNPTNSTSTIKTLYQHAWHHPLLCEMSARNAKQPEVAKILWARLEELKSDEAVLSNPATDQKTKMMILSKKLADVQKPDLVVLKQIFEPDWNDPLRLEMIATMADPRVAAVIRDRIKQIAPPKN